MLLKGKSRLTTTPPPQLCFTNNELIIPKSSHNITQLQDRKQFFRTWQLLAPTAWGRNILTDTRYTSGVGSTTKEPVVHSYEPCSPRTTKFSRGPLTLASAHRCEVSKQDLKYSVSLIAGRKDCLRYLTSVTSPLWLRLSKRQEHSILPQSSLFDSSCLLSSICCNFSHNPIKFNGLVWMRNHETDQSPINLTVLLAKLNNVTALYKMWVSE